MRTSDIFKVYFLIFILSFLPSCSTIKTSRNNDKYPVTFVYEYGVRGVIFPDTVFIKYANIPDFLIGRFSPTQDDIFLFEKIFHANFLSSTRILPEKYSHWVRHYYGFYNDKGEKIFWVIFIQLNRHSRKMWRKGPYFQLPGSLEILCNIDTGNFMNFQ